MGAEELLDGIRVRPGGVGGNQCIKELHESFRGARRKVVDRMTDDVGVNMLVEVVGIPAKFENRTVTGVEFCCRCGARVSEAASGDGVNTPVSRTPFACAGLNPGRTPPFALSNV